MAYYLVLTNYLCFGEETRDRYESEGCGISQFIVGGSLKNGLYMASRPNIPEKAGIANQEDAQSRISGVRNFTGAFNLAGLPALSLPCGFTSKNLPLSIQMAGRPMEEELLFRLGHTYQQITDWHLRRAPEPVD